MFETVFLVNECANKWINITRGIMKIKHLAQNFISVDKNLIKQENPCVSQTNCVERVWKIWIFIQVKNEYSRERDCSSTFSQKLNVSPEPIAPDLHLCKMNIGNYTCAHR